MCAMRCSCPSICGYDRATGDRSRERYRDRERDLSTVLVDATCAMGALELQLEAAGDGFMHLVYGLNYGAVRRRSRLRPPPRARRVPGVRDAPHGPRDRGTTQEKTDTFAQHLAQRQYDRDCVHICVRSAVRSRGRADLRRGAAQDIHLTVQKGAAAHRARRVAWLPYDSVLCRRPYLHTHHGARVGTHPQPAPRAPIDRHPGAL